VAVVEATADRELAAYVLARAGLRRTGADPRNVKFAYVVGLDDRWRRHLSRLWVGTTIGPPDDPASFTGPVDDALRQEFLAAQAAWSEHPDVEVVCPGGELQRADDPSHYLAPALFATDWPAPELPVAGPMLVLVRCNENQARAGAEAAAREDAQIIAIGARMGRYLGDVRYIRGALLVERLPPGLPKPRPV
jgi:acyl-CoA reductase-like NAD-dependent aldehyde dehydrogenase